MNRRSPAPKAGALNQISLRPGTSNNGRDGWDRTIIPGSKAPCPAVGPHPYIKWSGRSDLNRRSPAPEAGTISQTSLRPGNCKMVPASGFKPASSGYRPDALSAELHGQKFVCRQGLSPCLHTVSENTCCYNGRESRTPATITLHSLQNATINAAIMQSHFLQRKSASELRFLRRTSVLGRTTGIGPADAGSTVRRPSIGLHPPYFLYSIVKVHIYKKERALFRVLPVHILVFCGKPLFSATSLKYRGTHIFHVSTFFFWSC